MWSEISWLSRRIFSVLFVCLVLIPVGLTCCRSSRSVRPDSPATGGAGVHGSIFTDAARGDQAQWVNDPIVYVPDFEVHLVNAVTGAKSPSVRTDLFGRYIFRRHDPGRYRLCWDMPGWVPGCGEYEISIGNNTKYPPQTRVRPLVTATSGPVFGRVLQNDGSSPWTYDQYFGLNETATLTANEGQKVVATARANVAGDYILTAVPRAAVTINAQLGAAGRSRDLTPVAFDSGTGVAVADFAMTNRPPTLGAVTAFVGGRGVRESDPGIEVEVRAEVTDPDGDPVHVAWKQAPANGTISGSGPVVRWRLATGEGLQTLYVVASDGNGGYARKRVSLATGRSEVRFSGTVITQGGAPIDAATIEINGVEVAASDPRGAFSAPVRRALYYVVNVRKHGFADYSRIYDHGNVRDIYPLVRTQVRTVDPTGVIDITDTREEMQRKQRRGVRLILQPNTLVAEDGKPATGPLLNGTATLDIANAEMPGNFGAIADGVETNLISFGAAFTNFTDEKGRRYNLRSGATARIILPVPAVMLATAPQEIVLWSYNTRTGLWDDSAGSAKLDRGTGVYVGDVRHFSSINTDIEMGAAACLRVNLDTSVPPSTVKVRVSYVSGLTLFVQTPELILDATENALLRLPPNDVVRVQAFDAAGSTVISNMVVLDNNITPAPNGDVNIGPATVPVLPTTPYANCHSVTIKLQVPNWGGFPASPFLTFPGGSEGNAVGYYTTVNPGSTFDVLTQTWSGGNRDTLGQWWAQAGFGPNGEDNGGIRASYLNHNDLGFGRDMHIRSSGGDVFAYVTNYGGPDQNPVNADDAQAQNPLTRAATVCMEYTTQPGVAGRIVKFFVYAGNGGGAAAKLVNSADLDNIGGQKFVPNLCQNCHGGVFYNPGGVPSPLDISLRTNLAATVGASFREFDIPAFRYPGGAVTPDAATKQALFDLNQLVKLSNPQLAISQLIDGWYAASPPDQDNNWAPNEWKTGITGSAATEPLYRDVVGRSCRTCHVGFASDQNQGLNWNQYSQFQAHRLGIKSAVCGSYKYMPHALFTYKNFWLSTSPNRPAALKSFNGPGWAPIGTCE